MKRLAVVALLSIAFSVYAQESITVGELISKGGRKLSKDEVASMHAGGVTIVGTVAANPRRKFENTFNQDGTFAGRTTDQIGQNGYGLVGKWSINNDGQLCLQGVRNSSGQDVTPTSPCSFQFLLGDIRYASTSEAPDSLAYPRQFRK